jgi:hypothetical protein
MTGEEISHATMAENEHVIGKLHELGKVDDPRMQAMIRHVLGAKLFGTVCLTNDVFSEMAFTQDRGVVFDLEHMECFDGHCYYTMLNAEQVDVMIRDSLCRLSHMDGFLGFAVSMVRLTDARSAHLWKTLLKNLVVFETDEQMLAAYQHGTDAWLSGMLPYPQEFPPFETHMSLASLEGGCILEDGEHGSWN